jgi:alkanesulfonate monooxygenase SsuD/methylene tetrahydromethanopterin reductase-like flavin-dependent oxidoreductase (luciferase family)
VEYTSLGENFHNRGRRVEEQVQLLRMLWQQPLVTFQGKYHHIPDAGLNPLPAQRPIPIWFGGHAEPMLRRAARLGDGWMPNYRIVEQAKPSLEQFDRLLEEAGRSRSDFGLHPRLSYGNGDPTEWESILKGWQGAGATHLSFNTMGSGFAKPQDHLAALQRMAESLGVRS